jgi:hypothetical protein
MPPTAAWRYNVKITRLLLVFFILFGSAMPLNHAVNQPAGTAKLAPALNCCDFCPPICPAK